MKYKRNNLYITHVRERVDGLDILYLLMREDKSDIEDGPEVMRKILDSDDYYVSNGVANFAHANRNIYKIARRIWDDLKSGKATAGGKPNV
jgi:hypothetical protein